MATRLYNDSNDCRANSNRPHRLTAVDVAPKSHRFRKRARTLILLAGIGLTLLPSTGCNIVTNLRTQFKHNSALDDFLIDYRNDAWAAKAWHCRKHRFGNRRNLKDLEAGFRAGYMAIAEGGNGCVPAVCPQAYWGFQYQDCNGQARMNSWFEGYPLGVAAAEEDGIGHWSQVPTSLPMPAPVQPTVPPGPSVMGPAAGGAAAGALGAGADAEPIMTPAPDPAANRVAPAETNPAPNSSSKSKPAGSAAPADSLPNGDVKKPAPTAPKVETIPATPLNPPPKPAAPVAPPAKPEPLKLDTPPAKQPSIDDIFNTPAKPETPADNADPFGFN